MPSTASLEIFRAGRHVAMSGESIAFSESDLAASVAAYDPALHEAPLVVGHPKHDTPAYGVVRSLAVSGSSIEATPDHVDPAFAEMVNAKRFSKISASFYAPEAPSNPVPGVYYLRHVGFLGAQPPAVKGLRTPSFADGETGIVEFAEWDDVNNASLWRSLRDWMLSKFGASDADRAVPGYLVQSVEQGAQDELREERARAADITLPSFAEDEPTMTAQEIAALQAENARLKADADALRRSQAELRRTALHAENIAFAEQLGSEGRLAAEHQPVIVAALDALASGDKPIEFGEGDAKQPLSTAVREVLAKLPQSVEFSELATPKRAAAGAGGVVNFAAPDGATVDQASLAMHGKFIAYQARHKVSYEQAIDAVLGGAA